MGVALGLSEDPQYQTVKGRQEGSAKVTHRETEDQPMPVECADHRICVLLRFGRAHAVVPGLGQYDNSR